jgi:hypothetical protein
MVAGMLRHMRSLRSMRRDHGWIHTLLEEAENERMHLLTFLQLRQPGPLFRAMVLLAQVGARPADASAMMHVRAAATCSLVGGVVCGRGQHAFAQLAAAHCALSAQSVQRAR